MMVVLLSRATSFSAHCAALGLCRHSGMPKSALNLAHQGLGFDGPVFFFLAFLRPGSAGVRWGEEKKKSKHQHFCIVIPDFLFYLEFEMVIRDSPSQVERKSNFFSNFPLHIYLQKETRF